MTLYPHHLTVTSSLSPEYETMNMRYTDAICILGFADCSDSSYFGMVTPVTSINEMFNIFSGNDSYDSTLLKGMIEAYTAGCRDIYLYPIASMDYYQPTGDDVYGEPYRDAAWWEDLESFYTDALSVLTHYDIIDVLIPYDADITERGFVSQFATHCNNLDGAILRVVYFSYSPEDETTEFEGEDYHIVLVDGTGTFSFLDHFDNEYSSGMATVFAGTVSRLETSVPPDNRLIRFLYLFSSDYEDDEESLEENHIVGFRKTASYKRVYNTDVVSTLSYTRAEEGSDFQSLWAVHVVQRFLHEVSKMELVGNPAYQAQDKLRQFFGLWEAKGYVYSIEADFSMINDTLYVNVVLNLPYPIGGVELSMTVGPVY